MWSLTLNEHPLPALQWGIVLGASLVAARFDARSRRIPNWLTGPLFLTGLVGSSIAAGSAGAAEAGLASVLLSLPYILLFLFGGGPAPAAPGPTTEACGPDPDEEGSAGDLGCNAYSSC